MNFPVFAVAVVIVALSVSFIQEINPMYAYLFVALLFLGAVTVNPEIIDGIRAFFGGRI